ncbi:MAG: hypothetical protein JWN37_829 [Candidatus Nomurabacteria bacterium]|nr:hypothetical protein [Candidatus Nomurabacteria bacterium]
MAQSFSTKKYFSKLFAHQLLSELAQKHNTQLFFEINDQTPRKLAVELMEDSVKSMDTDNRINFLKDLSYISSITNSHSATLGKKLFKNETGKDFEPEVECATDTDVVLYFFLRHNDIADKLSFLTPFYSSKSYFGYEARKMEKVESEVNLTELEREFEKLANKDNATEFAAENMYLENVLYIESIFHGAYDVGNKMDVVTGEMSRKHISRKIEVVRIAYIPQEEIVLISGNIPMSKKLIFLDTFLRIMFGTGYEEKVESYNLAPLRDLSIDFTKYNKDTPFIKAHITSTTFSYAKGKKKLRISVPSSIDKTNMQALQETLNELGLQEKFNSFEIMNMSFKFIFQNKEKIDKSVSVTCSLSPTRASLCPLFEYELYTKKILKNAGIYEGFKLPESEKATRT